MKVLTGLSAFAQLPRGAAISIGNFDGVHRGHQAICIAARALRDQGQASATAIVTFEPHPLTVLRPQAAPPRLTPADVKHELLAQAGVDFLVSLAPDPAVLDLSAEDFWQTLHDNARPASLLEGESFSFGKGRRGNVQLLGEWTKRAGVDLHVVPSINVPLLDMQVAPVSSSLLRWLLAYGRVRDAAICLGRGYQLQGEVIRGKQLGRQIGVPTANLAVQGQMIPADGVYAGRCTISGQLYPAAVSIGTAPTVGDGPLLVEAHLIGFSGDLYGQVIHVELIDWLREQRRYAGLEALSDQIAIDLRATVDRARLNPARPASVISLA